MSYFLSTTKLLLNKESVLTGDEVAHILYSRRSKNGDAINIQDVTGNRYTCEIIEAKKSSIIIKPVKKIIPPIESALDLHLFQAYISEQALDMVIQKTTELGLSKLVIFQGKNSPQVLKPEQLSKKLERWQKISWEAAKQSDRLKALEIKFVSSLEKALTSFSGKLAVAHNEGKSTVSLAKLKFNPTSSAGVIIGPEGGLSKEELKICILNKAAIIGLGPRTLRAETAAIATVSVLQACFGDLE